MKIPEALVASYHRTPSGRAWPAAPPTSTADFLDRWDLRPDGPATNGMASLVLPVVRADGTPAVLKLQPATEDNAAAPIALRTWDGNGVVPLLDDEPGAMLLERLDATRPLAAVADPLPILADLLARLVAPRRTAPLRPAHRSPEPGPRPRHGVDTRPGAPERPLGRRRRRNRPEVQIAIATALPHRPGPA